MLDVSRKAIGYINAHMRGGSRSVKVPAGKNVFTFAHLLSKRRGEAQPISEGYA